MQFFPGLLVGCVLIMAAAFYRERRGTPASQLRIDFAIAAVFAAYPVMLLPLNAITYMRPATVDATLYALDRSVGLDAFTLINLTNHTRWLYLVLFNVYGALPIVIALSWALERSRRTLCAVAVAPLLAMVFYYLVPAVGPVHVADALNFPRNAFPSMHLSWALLVAFGARGRKWRVVAEVFAVLTAVSTIGSGEHYYVDLAAAIPFSLGVHALCYRVYGSEAATEAQGRSPKLRAVAI